MTPLDLARWYVHCWDTIPPDERGEQDDATMLAQALLDTHAQLEAIEARETTLITALEAERMKLRALLAEALDWATRFDGRHNREPHGYSSEMQPMFMRIGARHRDERLAAIRKETGL